MTEHCYSVHYSESPKCYFDWCSDGAGCYTDRNDPFSDGAGDERSPGAVGGPEGTATWKEGVQAPRRTCSLPSLSLRFSPDLGGWRQGGSSISCLVAILVH